MSIEATLMKTATSHCSDSKLTRAGQRRTCLLACAWMLSLASALNLRASTVTTIGGGPNAGYTDGDTLQTSLFNNPSGIALDSTENLLYVADLNNNAVRLLDLQANLTETFTTAGVTYDGFGN